MNKKWKCHYVKVHHQCTSWRDSEHSVYLLRTSPWSRVIGCVGFISFPAPPAAPETPSAVFSLPGQQFTITWDEPPLYKGETFDSYFLNISGPDDLCGRVNTLLRFGNHTHSYICSGWLPAGQKYTFTLQAANCGGNQRGPESYPLTVCLQGKYIWRLLVVSTVLWVIVCFYCLFSLVNRVHVLHHETFSSVLHWLLHSMHTAVYLAEQCVVTYLPVIRMALCYISSLNCSIVLNWNWLIKQNSYCMTMKTEKWNLQRKSLLIGNLQNSVSQCQSQSISIRLSPEIQKSYFQTSISG